MDYISTRGESSRTGFTDAVMTGLARDGGLLLPDGIPDVREKLAAWARLDYAALAEAVMGPFVDLAPPVLNRLVGLSCNAFRHPEVTPVVKVGERYVLELFHGPTLAFKDVALQFLGNLFEYVMQQRHDTLNIVGATSGDTGSAAIYGVRGKDRIRIFIMHPHKRVSPVQERQLTSVLDENVFNLAIDGTFDDCQSILKTLFRDLDFKDRHSLGSINSINWARVLAQIVYYFYAGLRVMTDTGAGAVQFTVPTGNFGDIFAGYMAARMGLPVRRLVLATNENDILARFFNKGDYSLGPVHATLSPSMDIQVASNFERYLYYREGEQAARVRELMDCFALEGRLSVEPGRDAYFAAGTGTTADTLTTIRQTWQEHGYLLDPHTAVGVHVSQAFADQECPMICLATAHPAKFPDTIKDAVGEDIARHPVLDALRELPTRCDVLPNSAEAVREYVERHVS
jgi:threonine synthase